ncbi:MAG: M1 family aminopeptidase, partial [Myxococcota bacterium]
PSYLFALAVGPLDIVEGDAIPANDVRSEPLPFRGIAARGRGDELAYTMEHTGAIVAQLEAYFGIPYPYDKLDVVAVPDFEAGAMENVGLITFRDTILLVDPDRTPARRMRFWAYIMAHEVAHMWFGNLVTMAWWDDLWLNEAFASWIEHPAVDGWRPAYEADVSLTEWVHRVYGSDSLASARAIRQPIVTTDDIHNAFDGITYGKGAGVLRMFEGYVGKERFRDGIRAYLRAHRFGSASADDFTSMLIESFGQEVSDSFNTFLTQPGLPLVHATLECGEGGAMVRLRQSRYAPVGSSASQDNRWHVPVCVSAPTGRGRRAEVATQCVLLAEPEGELSLGDYCPDWFHPNAGARGYYRFSMEGEQLAALQRASSRLSVSERLALADSITSAFDAGQIEAEAAIDASLALASDPHHTVATANLPFLQGLLRLVDTDDQRAALRRRYARAYASEYRQLRWAPRRGRSEDESVRLRRSRIVPFVAFRARDAAARREGLRLGRLFLNGGGEGANTDAIVPELVEAALAVTIQDGTQADFDRAMELLAGATDGLLRRQLLVGLGATEDGEQATQVMTLALTDALRVNEFFLPFQRQFGNPARRAAAFQWLQNNFDAVLARLPPGYAGYLPTLMGSACSEDEAAQALAFFEPRVGELPGGPRNAAQTAESIRLCVALRAAQGPQVAAVAR